MSPNSDTTTDVSTAVSAVAPTAVPTACALTVTLPANLHARPAGKLAQAAARFSSVIRLEYAGRSVNPTGVLAVMSLGATAGTTVTLRAEGDDADEAVQALADILANAE